MYFSFFVQISVVSDNGRAAFLVFLRNTPGGIAVFPDFSLVCFLKSPYYLTCARIPTHDSAPAKFAINSKESNKNKCDREYNTFNTADIR